MELGNYREALEYFMNDLDYCEEVYILYVFYF